MRIVYYPQRSISVLNWQQEERLFSGVPAANQLVLLSDQMPMYSQAYDITYRLGFSLQTISNLSVANTKNEILTQTLQLADCVISDAPITWPLYIPQLILPEQPFQVEKIILMQQHNKEGNLTRIIPVVTRLFPTLPIILSSIVEEFYCADCIKETMNYIKANSNRVSYQMLSIADIIRKKVLYHSIVISAVDTPLIKALQSNELYDRIIFAGLLPYHFLYNYAKELVSKA
jgi:hypothetical protein